MSESSPVHREDALISLSPSEVISFKLERGTSPKTALRVTNNSEFHILFKVKTTVPSWYFVRPNQRIVAPGMTEEVSIVLLESISERFLDMKSRGEDESLEKHRFQVQSKVISDTDYNRISAIASANRVDEYSKLWSGDVELRSVKLKVDYKYPADIQIGSSSSRAHINSVSENVNAIRHKMPAAESSQNRSSDSVSATRTSPSVSATSITPEILSADLRGLKKKFDDVIAYTVKLTAERDNLVEANEKSTKELAREIAKRKTGDTPTAIFSKSDSKNLVTKVTDGFSFFILMLITLMAFSFGRYGNEIYAYLFGARNIGRDKEL